MNPICVYLEFKGAMRTPSKKCFETNLDANLETYHVGARSKGLNEDILLATLDSRYTQVGFNLVSVKVCVGFNMPVYILPPFHKSRNA